VGDAIENERDGPFLTDLVRGDGALVPAMPAHLALDEAWLIVGFELIHFNAPDRSLRVKSGI
jgi:hypothetical protein